MQRYKTVDDYILHHKQWQEELIALRKIMNSTKLQETVKWGAPVYTVNGKNIVGLGAFKSYVGLWFFQGALLKDIGKKLINAQEEKTKAMRQWRFNSFDEIDPKLINQFLEEAIANQKAGKQIKPNTKKPLIIPPDLENVFQQNKNVESRFSELSLTCKREYAEYIAEAKREETKVKRLEKIIPMILEKKGLHDNYR